MRQSTRIVICSVILAVLLAACAAAVPSSPSVLTPIPQSQQQQHPILGEVELSFMTYNIWLGGEVVDFNKVIEVIQVSGADVVGLQEAEGNTRRIAEKLGWYADERLMVISRYPVIEPPEAQSAAGVDYVYIQIAPGQIIAFSNIHLTSDPYGPYAVRDGESLDFVLEQEVSLRVPEIEERLASWQEVISADTPLVVTGDFNTPSHLDWTDAAVNSLPHMKYAVQWPVTFKMDEAGFVDTFRAVNPDPITDPGRTWTYGYPYPRLNSDEAIDRIDYVFASGNVKVISSKVIGPPGTPNADITVSPYPGDHRAVVSTIRMTPVEPPVFVAADHARVVSGERLVVRYHAPDGEETDRIAILKAGGKIPDDEIMWLPPQEAGFFGAVRFGTGNLPPKEYDAVLVGKDNLELSRVRFWVVAPIALPILNISNKTVASNETIIVEWRNAPAQMRDWVGIYPAGTLDLYNGYWGYAYTGATVSGNYSFTPEDLGLPPGDYIAALFSDDGYAILAQTAFTVNP